MNLRLADWMSFNVHLQVIHAETTYDILLEMDFTQQNCDNSGFCRNQDGPRERIEIVDIYMILQFTLDIIPKLQVLFRKKSVHSINEDTEILP